MLDEKSPETFTHLKELSQLYAKHPGHPFVVWLGAGVGRWAGYPGWKELAEALDAEFRAHVVGYDKHEATSFLETEEYSALFEICSTSDHQRYRREIVRHLKRRKVGEVFVSLLHRLRQLSPLYAITTNLDPTLDEMLGLPILGHSAIGAVGDALLSRESFLLKLHGTVADPGSWVLTQSDYRLLAADEAVRSGLENLFRHATILFLGFGLRDRYLISTIATAQHQAVMFGAGPHFVVLAAEDTRAIPFPDSVRTVRYVTAPQNDHRNCLQILNELTGNQEFTLGLDAVGVEVSARRESSVYVDDFFPPGEPWPTATSFSTSDGREYFIGTGFTAAEVGSPEASLWDFLCAAVAYDRVYLPLPRMDRLAYACGPVLLRELLECGLIHFVHWDYHLAVGGVPGDTALDVGAIVPRGTAGESRGETEPAPETAAEFIDRNLQHLPSQLQSIGALAVEATTTVSGGDPPVDPQLLRGLLLRPSLRRLLGVSDEALNLHTVPKWCTYPVLRLGRLVQIAVLGSREKLTSVRLDAGSAELCGYAFSTIGSGWTADAAASYALSGSLSRRVLGDLEAFRTLLARAMRFRAEPRGTQFRRDVAVATVGRSGNEISAAIDGAMESISAGSLERARQGYLSLFFASGTMLPALAIDGDSRMSQLKIWRQTAARRFEELVRANGLDSMSKCPCGSEMALKRCCQLRFSK